MHDIYVGGEVVLIVVALLVLVLVALALRRRLLAREGGTFECSLRLRDSARGGGWALGVARYNEENLEWFRFFSFATAPRQVFLRNDVNVLESRDPSPSEAVALYVGQRIVRIEVSREDQQETWELAMSSESLTGLLSWLEAAPPGVVGY